MFTTDPTSSISAPRPREGSATRRHSLLRRLAAAPYRYLLRPLRRVIFDDDQECMRF
jgi:hypothetical protein